MNTATTISEEVHASHGPLASFASSGGIGRPSVWRHRCVRCHESAEWQNGQLVANALAGECAGTMLVLPANWNSNGCGEFLHEGVWHSLGAGYAGSLRLGAVMRAMGGTLEGMTSDNGSRGGVPVPHWAEVRCTGYLSLPPSALPHLMEYSAACSHLLDVLEAQVPTVAYSPAWEIEDAKIRAALDPVRAFQGEE